jgi:membrane-associated protease RseP (regulator of RpoE activity)
VPYYEQDDPAHETPDARRKRAKLATDTSVTKAIETFIDAAFAAAGAKGDRVASFPREMYTAVMSAVARALIPSISYADAQRAVDDDWARDAGSGSAEAIDRARLHKAVFELVDLWTLGISAEEYVAFARVITAAAVVALSRVSLGVVVENEAGKPMIELARVNPGSAAAHAGMVPGGFITAINLTPTPSNSVFTTTIKTYSPGEFVTIKEHRGSLDAPETEIRVQLGAAGMTMAAFLQHWSILQHNKPRPGGRG